MRVAVLGGTRFIGRAVVEELTAGGHDVTVVHRGDHEPSDLPEVRHLHVARPDWPAHAGELRVVGADAVVDCRAITRDDARAGVESLPDTHLVLISSQDVYRAFEVLQRAGAPEPGPIDEASPLRTERYAHRGEAPEYEFYSKQDVEEEYAPRRPVVLRLPAVYGERDYQRREEFILRRVRAGRRRIPMGPGELLWTRGYVRDIARGICRAASDPSAAGEVFNLGEERVVSLREWAQRILEAAGSEAALVTVPDEMLPPDMKATASTVTQHVIVSTAKARERLGYDDTAPETAIRASVEWHLANPPEEQDADFSADDQALKG